VTDMDKQRMHCVTTVKPTESKGRKQKRRKTQEWKKEEDGDQTNGKVGERIDEENTKDIVCALYLWTLRLISLFLIISAIFLFCWFIGNHFSMALSSY